MKPTFARKFLFTCVVLFSFVGISQEFNNFEVRYQNNLRGDLTFIANNIVNRDGGTGNSEPEDAYNSTGNSSTYNDWLDMQYIDVDGDPSTFSSSSATFNFPERGPKSMIHPMAPRKEGMANVRTTRLRIVFLSGMSVRETPHAIGMAKKMENRTVSNPSFKVLANTPKISSSESVRI